MCSDVRQSMRCSTSDSFAVDTEVSAVTFCLFMQGSRNWVQADAYLIRVGMLSSVSGVCEGCD